MTEADKRIDYLIQWRQGLWTQIRQKEDALWRFITFFASAIILVFGFFQSMWEKSNIQAYNIVPILIVVISVSIWGILIVLDANYWMQRNLIFVGNIEREILTDEDRGKIIPKAYSEPVYKYTRSYEIQLMAFYFIIFSSIILCVMTVFPNHLIFSRRLAVGVGSFALIFNMGLLFIRKWESKWINDYCKVKIDAPGRNANPYKQPNYYVEAKLGLSSLQSKWLWILFIIGNAFLIFLSLIMLNWTNIVNIIALIIVILFCIIFIIGLFVQNKYKVIITDTDENIRNSQTIDEVASMESVNNVVKTWKYFILVENALVILSLSIWVLFISVTIIGYLLSK